jgi:hypothetical protein
LLVERHGLEAVAVAALPRIGGLHGRPDVLRQP